MISERLNAVFGIENWDVDFTEVNGDKAMKCGKYNVSRWVACDEKRYRYKSQIKFRN